MEEKRKKSLEIKREAEEREMMLMYDKEKIKNRLLKKEKTEKIRRRRKK